MVYAFNHLTVSQYQAVHGIMQVEKDVLEQDLHILSFLTGESKDYFEEMPLKRLQVLRQRIAWVRQNKFTASRKRYLFINGKPYKAISEARLLNTAQYTDIKTFLTRGTAIEQMHNILACIFIPLSWKGFRYSGKKHPDVAKAMLNVKISKVYPTVFFYSKALKNWIKAIQASGLKQVQRINKQALTQMRKGNLGSIGDGKSPLMN